MNLGTTNLISNSTRGFGHFGLGLRHYNYQVQQVQKWFWTRIPYKIPLSPTSPKVVLEDGLRGSPKVCMYIIHTLDNQTKIRIFKTKEESKDEETMQ